MNKEEISKLAREYAEQDIPCGDPDVTKADRDDMVDTVADYVEEILLWLLRDHCIVSRDTILNQHAWYMQRMKEVSSARQTNRAKAIALEAAFGTEIFKTKSDQQ